jgi:hypothetical protein
VSEPVDLHLYSHPKVGESRSGSKSRPDSYKEREKRESRAETMIIHISDRIGNSTDREQRRVVEVLYE